MSDNPGKKNPYSPGITDRRGHERPFANGDIEHELGLPGPILDYPEHSMRHRGGVPPPPSHRPVAGLVVLLLVLSHLFVLVDGFVIGAVTAPLW